MNNLREKSIRLGATDFGTSKVKGKRFYVIYNGKKINFGSDVGQTFIDHKDIKKKNAWIARHSKIMKNGQPAITNKESPSYWSRKILWP